MKRIKCGDKFLLTFETTDDVFEYCNIDRNALKIYYNLDARMREQIKLITKKLLQEDRESAIRR